MRALRRHHAERMKKHVRKLLIAREWWNYSPNNKKDKIYLAEQVKVRYNNYTKCSCSMCGNPRHNSWENPLTMAEHRNKISYYEWLQE